MSGLDFEDPTQCANTEYEWRVRNVEARFSFRSEVTSSSKQRPRFVVAWEVLRQDAMRELRRDRVSSGRIFIGMLMLPAWGERPQIIRLFCYELPAAFNWRDHPSYCPYLGKIIQNVASMLFPLSTPLLQCCNASIPMAAIMTWSQH